VQFMGISLQKRKLVLSLALSGWGETLPWFPDCKFANWLLLPQWIGPKNIVCSR
jgi:hypothetical protein